MGFQYNFTGVASQRTRDLLPVQGPNRRCAHQNPPREKYTLRALIWTRQLIRKHWAVAGLNAGDSMQENCIGEFELFNPEKYDVDSDIIVLFHTSS